MARASWSLTIADLLAGALTPVRVLRRLWPVGPTVARCVRSANPAVDDRSHRDESHGKRRCTMGPWIQEEAGMPEMTSLRLVSVRQGWRCRNAGDELVEHSSIDNSDAAAGLQVDRAELLQMCECPRRDLADGSHHGRQLVMRWKRDDGVDGRPPGNDGGNPRHHVTERQVGRERTQTSHSRGQHAGHGQPDLRILHHKVPECLTWHEQDHTTFHGLGIGDRRLTIECGGVAEGLAGGEVVKILLAACHGTLEDPHAAARDEIEPLRFVAFGIDQAALVVRARDDAAADGGSDSCREGGEIRMSTQDREWICHLQSSEKSSLAPDRQRLPTAASHLRRCR